LNRSGRRSHEMDAGRRHTTSGRGADSHRTSPKRSRKKMK
jgi:hypothetical protein